MDFLGPNGLKSFLGEGDSSKFYISLLNNYWFVIARLSIFDFELRLATYAYADIYCIVSLKLVCEVSRYYSDSVPKGESSP